MFCINMGFLYRHSGNPVKKMMDVEYFIYLSHGIVNERIVQIQFTLFVRQFYTNLNATDTSVGVGTDF